MHVEYLSPTWKLPTLSLDWSSRKDRDNRLLGTINVSCRFQKPPFIDRGKLALLCLTRRAGYANGSRKGLTETSRPTSSPTTSGLVIPVRAYTSVRTGLRLGKPFGESFPERSDLKMTNNVWLLPLAFNRPHIGISLYVPSVIRSFTTAFYKVVIHIVTVYSRSHY